MTYDNGHMLGSRYIVCEMLGRGGFGIVYRVRSTDDNSEFAPKTYRDECTHDERILQNFRTEALTWVSVATNATKFYDHFRSRWRVNAHTASTFSFHTGSR
jgi:serine/threonine protein kinase